MGEATTALNELNDAFEVQWLYRGSVAQWASW